MTRKLLRICLDLAMAGYVVVGSGALVLAILLAARAETLQGRLCGIAAFLFLPVPVLLALCGRSRHRRILFRAAGLMAAGALAILAVCALRAPSGTAPVGSPVRSVFSDATTYHRLSMAHLVPEIDQLTLATYVLPLVEGSERTRRVFLGIYREMAASPEFEELGSALNYTYLDMFLNRRPTGHFYEYIPTAARDAGRLPVILFIHGSLGNFTGTAPH